MQTCASSGRKHSSTRMKMVTQLSYGIPNNDLDTTQGFEPTTQFHNASQAGPLPHSSQAVHPSAAQGKLRNHLLPTSKSITSLHCAPRHAPLPPLGLPDNHPVTLAGSAPPSILDTEWLSLMNPSSGHLCPPFCLLSAFPAKLFL